MTWLFAFLRIVFGLLFIAASVSKIVYPAAFAQIIINYQLLPDIAVNPLALFLPWLELVCGAALVTNTFVRGSSAILNLLLLVFLGALWFNVSRGLDVSCGCFTVNPEAQGGMIDSAIRDTAIFALGLVVMVRGFIDAGHRRASMQIQRALKTPSKPKGRAGLSVDVPAPTIKDGVLVVGMASEGDSGTAGREPEVVAGEAASGEAIELGPTEETAPESMEEKVAESVVEDAFDGAEESTAPTPSEPESAAPESDGVESPVPLPGEDGSGETLDGGAEFAFDKGDANAEFSFDGEENGDAVATGETDNEPGERKK